ncbi:MAG: ABC transporter substrate-binding protein [Bacillota bacterium]
MKKVRQFMKAGITAGLVLVLALTFSVMVEAQDDVPNGGWLDEIVAVEENSLAGAISQLEQNDIQLFGHSMNDPDLFEDIAQNPDIDYFESYGSYPEITFNFAGDPTFDETGEFNPFSEPKVREAMNYLIDREYIADEIYGGRATSRFLTISSAFNDYSKLITKARELEAKYAHDPEKAEKIITEEMEEMGAEKEDGTWHYDGEPVELEFVIRTEDEREQIGDYVSILLEDIGFEVKRVYVTMENQAPRTLMADPEEGKFHLTTMGWVHPLIYRDEGTTFDMMFTNRVYTYPLFQALEPKEEFADVADRLQSRDFSTLEERQELMEKALEYSMEDSFHIYLVDAQSYTPYRSEVSVAGDLAAVITGSMLWANTVRYEDEVGGSLDLALSSLFSDPWNPLDGSNDSYDLMLMEATADHGFVADPYTGLHRPMRIEKAEVYIEEGLPVEKTLDWVDLEFVEENEVPDDAWADWDAEEQKFITAEEKYEDDETAKRRTRVYYPDDFFEEVDWHDGSSMSMADIVYRFILAFDRAKEESDFYDEEKVSSYQTFMDDFRGMKIISTDPLTIDYYSDLYYLDAEQYVFTGYPFPSEEQSEGAWHNLALGQMAEEEEEAAYTRGKADDIDGEWLNFVGGPSLDIMEDMLDTAQEENYVPYEPTLSEYLDEGEVDERWDNLESWYEDKEHFWLGTGPYYLESVQPVEKIVHLKRYKDYADPADRWSKFDEPMRPEVDVSAPDVINVGKAAEADVSITFEGEPYPSEQINEVDYILFDTNKEVVHSGSAEEVDEGEWKINLSEEATSKLSTGSTSLEVIVTSNTITLPSIEQQEIVTFK